MAKKSVYHTFNLNPMVSKGCVLTKSAFLGKNFTVVPVSMIVSGAYMPGGGDEPAALFFDEKDLEKSKDTWNGRPASLGHPTNGITMNNPETFDERWLGFVFNTKYEKDNKRLSAQLWLEDNRGDEVINKVTNGEEIDVSIGAFGNVVASKGESNGVEYSYKFTDIRGDHLAVLPESSGACGWGDGCGIRAEYATKKQNDGCEDKTKVDIKENKGIGMEDKKCVKKEVEEVRVMSSDDIMKNPEKYDKDILDAIRMRDEAKQALVAKLSAIEFDGGPLCNKMLTGMDIKELSSLSALASHYESKLAEDVAVAAEAPKKVDYALAAGAAKETSNKIAPVSIKW